MGARQPDPAAALGRLLEALCGALAADGIPGPVLARARRRVLYGDPDAPVTIVHLPRGTPAEPESAAADEQLVEELAWMIVRIENNYQRETSGPGSRFEGQRLETAQVRAVLRRLREMGWREP